MASPLHHGVCVCVTVCGHRAAFYGKAAAAEEDEDKGVFMEMKELVSDVNVLYVLFVTGLAP